MPPTSTLEVEAQFVWQEVHPGTQVNNLQIDKASKGIGGTLHQSSYFY